MSQPFKAPDFGDKHVELRGENNEVAVYVTTVGLRRLIDLCSELLADPSKGHVHLEDYGLLTASSLRGAIAIFPRKQ